MKTYTLNNRGSLEETLCYYYHATPGEPLQGSPRVKVLEGSFERTLLFRV